MKRHSNVLGTRAASALGLALVLLAPVAADAYILSAEFLCKLLADRRADTKIRDLTIQLRTDEDGHDGPIDERIYLKSPQRLRWVQETEDGRVYLEKEGRHARGTESSLTPGKGPAPFPIATLLAPKGDDNDQRSKQILDLLGRHKVDTSVVSLARFEGEPAYVIGAMPWEPAKPQLWLDKQSTLPVRMLTGPAGKRQEVRFLEWGSAAAGNWFPRVVEEYRNGELFRRSELTDIKPNQKLPETLFDIPNR